MPINHGGQSASLYLGSTAVDAYLGVIKVSSSDNTSAFFTSTRETSMLTNTIQSEAASTTGYVGVRWWDSTSEVVGTGVSGEVLAFAKFINNVAGEKTYEIYPSDSEGEVSGFLTYLKAGNNLINSVSVSGLASLEFLDVSNNILSALNLSGLASLETLVCNNNSLSTLNVAALELLQTLACSQNNLTSLNVSGLQNLTRVVCDDNSLTSLRAEDVELSYGNDYYYYNQYGSSVTDNDLDATAINQFFSDLEETETGILFVSDNPGSATCDTTIATLKGYVVFT